MSQKSNDGVTTAAVAAMPLSAKRKAPPTSPISSSPTNIVVDEAFKRLFGYSWGTKFVSGTSSSTATLSPMEHEMIQIFGPTRTARIMNLPWDVVAPNPPGSTSLPKDNSYNPAAMLTTKIAAIGKTSSASYSATAKLQSNFLSRGRKRMRLEEIDYKSIALPDHMVSAALPNASGPSSAAEPTTVHKRTTASANPVATSNLDSILGQIAGKKSLNTVEKSSNDWEGFKETDKTLQDELERNAQSKNAYLVKQDFLNRVDHRKFELEKEERDRERSRRATDGSK